MTDLEKELNKFATIREQIEYLKKENEKLKKEVQKKKKTKEICPS